MTIEELKDKLAKAQANYARCGCKIYLEEANALQTRINQLQAEK